MLSKLTGPMSGVFSEAPVSLRPSRPLVILALFGLLARVAYAFWTGSASPHPDLGSFFPSALPFTHPFDTSPREPLFVWWLWLLGKAGIITTVGIRMASSFWFVPSLFLFFPLAARFLGAKAAWAAALLYAFLPGQIQSDTTGLRHLVETFGVLLLLGSLPADEDRRFPWRLTAALACLISLRISYLGAGLLFAGAAAWRQRAARPLLALLPALLLLAGHLQNNLARNGSLFYSATLHTSYIANMENLGRPGFPATVAEWQKDPYKQRLSFRQWALGQHSPAELVRDSFIGLSRGVWDFYEKVYFSLGLPELARVLMLALYALGSGLALADPRLRLVPLWLLLFTLPYAFTSHVFWAGRFFMPFTPLALILAVLGACSAFGFARRRLIAGRGGGNLTKTLR